MKFLSDKNRAILREVISTNFKVRYQGSALGYLWSLLKPLFIFAILYVVFTQVFKVGDGIEHYPVYLLLGIVLWSFFTEATTTGLSSIVDSGELIRKISIPRYLIVVASTVSALINLGLSLIVVLVFAIISHVPIGLGWLLLPVIILELTVLAQGLAFLLSATFVRLRDMSYIWEVILQAGFYITPIIYPLQKVTDITFQKLILINPVAQIIQDARQVFVTNDAITGWELGGVAFGAIPVMIVLVLFVVGALHFRRQSKTFAENI
jgi:ABC-2 type transport system permease protein